MLFPEVAGITSHIYMQALSESFVNLLYAIMVKFYGFKEVTNFQF